MATSLFFVLLKPDSIRRFLVGTILERFETRGFTLRKMRMFVPTKEVVETHYSEHQGKGFFGPLVDFTTSGPVIAMVWDGNIEVARKLVGATIPSESPPGTIRGDFACTLPNNLIHCSDSRESASREVELWGKYL